MDCHWCINCTLLFSASGEGNGNPLQYSCLENATDREAWRATVHRVTKNQTRLSTDTQKGAIKRQAEQFTF